MTPTSNDRTDDTGTATTPRPSLWQRVPKRLFGGRLRTSTAALVVVFIGLLMLYGQRADHYKQIDEEKAAASVSRTAVPRTTEDTPEYTEPTSVPSSTSVSSRPSGPSGPSESVSGSVPTETVPTTTTTRPGFQFPTIPGIVLPGQTPTTTPVR